MKILYIQKFNIKFCSWINTTYESTCIQLQTLLQFGLGTNLSRDDLLRLVPHIQTKGWNQVRVHHTSITSHRKRIQNQQKEKKNIHTSHICCESPCSSAVLFSERTMYFIRNRKEAYHTLSFTMVVVSLLLLHSSTTVSLCTGLEDPCLGTSKQDPFIVLHRLILTLLIIFPSAFYKIKTDILASVLSKLQIEIFSVLTFGLS